MNRFFLAAHSFVRYFAEMLTVSTGQNQDLNVRYSLTNFFVALSTVWGVGGALREFVKRPVAGQRPSPEFWAPSLSPCLATVNNPLLVDMYGWNRPTREFRAR